jgi:hypothetical protein
VAVESKSSDEDIDNRESTAHFECTYHTPIQSKFSSSSEETWGRSRD